jgi:hypothetical protein
MSAKIKLLQTFNYADSAEIYAFLNRDAEYAFVVVALEIGQSKPGDISAQFLKREGDKLVPTYTLKIGSTGFNAAQAGLADPNLQNLYILDSSSTELRARRLSRQLETVATATFTNYDVASEISFFADNVSSNGKFIFLGYALKGGGYTYLLLNAETLKTVYTFPSGMIISRAHFFALTNKMGNVKDYLILGGYSGVSGVAPALSIYKIKGETPVLIDSIAQPQSVFSIDAYNYKPLTETLITIGNGDVITPKSPIFNFPELITGIPGDDKNVRFYKFNGKCLSLFYAFHTNILNPIIRLLPQKGYFLLHSDSLPGVDSIEQFKFKDNHPYVKVRSQLTGSVSGVVFPSVSDNNYLLIGGASGPEFLANSLLYKKAVTDSGSITFANTLFEKIEFDDCSC